MSVVLKHENDLMHFCWLKAGIGQVVRNAGSTWKLKETFDWQPASTDFSSATTKNWIWSRRRPGIKTGLSCLLAFSLTDILSRSVISWTENLARICQNSNLQMWVHHTIFEGIRSLRSDLMVENGKFLSLEKFSHTTCEWHICQRRHLRQENTSNSISVMKIIWGLLSWGNESLSASINVCIFFNRAQVLVRCGGKYK